MALKKTQTKARSYGPKPMKMAKPKGMRKFKPHKLMRARGL